MVLGFGLAGLAVAVIALLVVRVTPLWDRLLAPGEVPQVDFASLRLSDKPNQFLVCPPDLCTAPSDMASPVFSLPVAELRQRLHRIVETTGETRLQRESDEDATYLARTRLMRWPDWITVRYIALDDGRSTLAIYSRSVYGRSDFGANRQRVTDWLQQLANQ